ncbi:carboxymuconolactone decarboxylase family protein [Sphingobium nicotianae]|uniref:Carboxymuconolactone decarboxylase family protein n=1 Tax=Sphingobium nicotianae TaxID=2782607 RepID=A0A9X1DCJ3_9SPHN|nr:carboxymuconolactone decarboxylase family protein [Sphingobium nicotianae]MBT2187374.1 carboxymuconolactone decarboxylase family protein [Sphingobium nicotianae]
MPMDKPRLPPLKDGELTDAQEEIIGPFRKMGADFNVARTMARHPRMLTAFRVWATYVMIDKNKLPEREREIMALRTAWRIQSDYVWSRHLSYARNAKLTDEEVVALKRPLGSHNWAPADLALVKAADALVSDFFIPDDIWAELVKYFDEEQLIDAIFVVGHFVMMGSFLNTAGVPLDPDVPYDPDLDRFK